MRVNSFVREDCPYTFVLSSLFPLVSHSAEVARLLKMSEVRSNDLETGLSSSNDHVVSGATSVSTPYKAWNISCSFTLMRFFFYEADFANGLRFLNHPFVKELFSYLHLDPTQLVPNSWRILVSCMVV